MTDMDCVLQIEMLAHGRRVRRVMIHIVALAHLTRTAMTTSIMSNNAIALAEEV
jgi:hypothetical protein